MVKFIFIAALPFLLFVLGLAPTSQAMLVDRGGGMIYDTTLHITWLQDAN
jgi:hypothetical protein